MSKNTPERKCRTTIDLSTRFTVLLVATASITTLNEADPEDYLDGYIEGEKGFESFKKAATCAKHIQEQFDRCGITQLSAIVMDRFENEPNLDQDQSNWPVNKV